MVFFKGNIDGTGSHEDLAEEIATSGKKWAKEFWRMEDMTACESRFVSALF